VRPTTILPRPATIPSIQDSVAMDTCAPRGRRRLLHDYAQIAISRPERPESRRPRGFSPTDRTLMPGS
jgi:hypothetical protein